MTNKEFFITRKGLYVSSAFLGLINTDIHQGLNTVDYFDLQKNAHDIEIKQKPVNIDTIRYLLEKQSEGQDSVLLTNSYTNIFYVVGLNKEMFVVSVFWNADYREWGVDAWRRDKNGYWRAGVRVFRNTEILSSQYSELKSLNLEGAIELVKKAGYKVIKEM